MRIGIYGGLANNMYVFAKAIREQGVDVCFIRDRLDRYPISQPVWEDCEFRLTLDEMAKAGAWDAAQWRDFENKLGWKAPAWLFDPASVPVTPEAATSGSPLDAALFRHYMSAPHRPAVLRQMRKCDGLLVCGVEGSVLAARSGRPYVIWPFGGDMSMAAGQVPLPSWRDFKLRITQGAERRWLRAAFRGAVCVGSHEPTGISWSYYGAESYIRTLRLEFLPIPIAIRPRPPVPQRRQWLDGFLAEFGARVAPDRLIGFVPSRVDYYWKGHDRLLRAVAGLAGTRGGDRLHLVFAGWGSDHAAATRFAAENGISATTTFLGAALSKPLLLRMYGAADFVVDQFKVGMYGTAALEAMACGAPLLTWLSKSFDRPWGIPPVINAESESEIRVALRDIAEGRVDLETTGRRLQEWMTRVHDAKAVTRRLVERLSAEALAA